MVRELNQRFPRCARLGCPADFARVFEFRRSAANGLLVLYACPSLNASVHTDKSSVRLGISVSRRIGNAVVRNRWKRRLREAFRSGHSRFPPGNDLIIVVRSANVPAGAAGARAVEEMIVALANRVVDRPSYATAAASAAVAASPPTLRPKRRR